MRTRLLSSLVGVAYSVLVILYSQYLLLPTIAAVGIIAFYEFCSVFKTEAKPLVTFGILFAILHFALLFYCPIYTLYHSMIFLIFLLCVMVIRYEKYNIKDVAVTYAGYIYTIVFFSYMYLLASIEVYAFYPVLVLCIAWGADTGGYFIGCAFGKHRLCEALSPKKSWEGFFGGILMSVLFSIAATYVYYDLNITKIYFLKDLKTGILFVTVTIFLSILSQIGDLVASSIKRYNKQKDFGNMIPGHGGILDRFDGVLFILPIVYIIMKIFFR